MSCAVCGRKVRNPDRVRTEDGQLVKVGPECWALIKAAGEAGYPSPRGKLYVVRFNPKGEIIP